MVAISSLVSRDSEHPEFIWRNGEIVPWTQAVVHVNAVGHASVSSVFEGIKAYWNVEQEQLFVFRLPEHMRRMLDSIRIVRLGNRFSLDNMVQGVIDILRANEIRWDTYIRPWVFIEGIVHEQMGPVAKSIDRAYHDLVRGIDCRLPEWRTPVWI